MIKIYVSEFLAGLIGIIGLSLIGGSIVLDNNSGFWRVGITLVVLDTVLIGVARQRRRSARELDDDVRQILTGNPQR